MSDTGRAPRPITGTIRAACGNSSWATMMHVQYLSTNVQRGSTRNYHRFVGSEYSCTAIPSRSSFDYTIGLLVVSFIIGLPLDRIPPSSADSFFLNLRAASPRSLWLRLLEEPSLVAI